MPVLEPIIVDVVADRSGSPPGVLVTVIRGVGEFAPRGVQRVDTLVVGVLALPLRAHLGRSG
jgi:hypothetical protein